MREKIATSIYIKIQTAHTVQKRTEHSMAILQL